MDLQKTVNKKNYTKQIVDDRKDFRTTLSKFGKTIDKVENINFLNSNLHFLIFLIIQRIFQRYQKITKSGSAIKI